MTLHARLPRPVLLALFAALATAFALPQVCFACTCIPAGPPLEALAEADGVFLGRVVAVQEGAGDVQPRLFTVEVTTVWKGSVTSKSIVQTGSKIDTCSYHFRVGEEYLIYGYANSQALLPDADYIAYLCSRTRPVSQAGEDLAALGPGWAPMPGLPDTGAGMLDTTASERTIPAALLIGGAILAFLAVIQHSRSNRRIAR